MKILSAESLVPTSYYRGLSTLLVYLNPFTSYSWSKIALQFQLYIVTAIDWPQIKTDFTSWLLFIDMLCQSLTVFVKKLIPATSRTTTCYKWSTENFQLTLAAIELHMKLWFIHCRGEHEFGWMLDSRFYAYFMVNWHFLCIARTIYDLKLAIFIRHVISGVKCSHYFAVVYDRRSKHNGDHSKSAARGRSWSILISDRLPTPILFT